MKYLSILTLLLSYSLLFCGFNENELFRALENNDMKRFKEIMNTNVNVNARKEGRDSYDDGATPLIIASSRRNKMAVSMLLSRGAQVNTATDNGRTAIMTAVDDLELTKMLVSRGASLYVKDKYGSTPLDYSLNHKKKEVIDYLATILSQNKSQESKDILNKAIYRAATSKEREIVDLLISKGADINGTPENSEPVIVNLASSENKYMIEFLLSKGANINAKDRSGETALMKATERGNKTMVEFLLLKGADINMQDNQGETALFKAIGYNHKEILSLLISKGADLNIIARNKSAIEHAEDRNYKDIAELLRKSGARKPFNILPFVVISVPVSLLLFFVLLAYWGGKSTSRHELISASISRNYKLVKALLDQGIDANVIDANGRTALMHAVMKNEDGIVKLLLEKGASIDVRDSRGLTAFLYSAASDLNTLKLLVQYGADMNDATIDGINALLLAASSGNADNIDLLLKLGLKINCQSANGITPLMAAAYNGKKNAVETFLLHGAKINLKTNFGLDAYSIAKKQGLEEIAETIRDFSND
ncbi:MAG: ankyrin repeat domain-containing protein [Candidatus Coatesbacteria bacterium]|nr:ankyrin repeat domain-containing protein [Candidatus Coatesbacteria bacterium]